jgi:hypothetical protein
MEYFKKSVESVAKVVPRTLTDVRARKLPAHCSLERAPRPSRRKPAMQWQWRRP